MPSACTAASSSRSAAGSIPARTASRVHAGLVELRAEDDANVFRERAEAALERAKQAAADRLSAAQ